ncbi:SprT-like domain-containing protein [Occultella gossypii]|uniref:SprT-like domain-containing protein n=1 Tax=Occultella gossypii TaxID=2800820 RepID=A0ABS7SA17_9MICO|nr:SprT-like domain-containing protein [Occultella gossypii]MBZ2196753.1 SprT-like domain-containing protein [Occultella gossypii]
MDLTDAEALGRELMAEHGLTGWTFGFDNAKRRAGACRYDRRRITISRYLTALHEPAQVRDTLLHEIAHALAGHGAGHGPRWRRIALEIGCTAQRRVPAGAGEVPAPWVGTCPAGHEHARFRRPTRALACGRCSARFSTAHLIVWQRREANVRR